MVVAHPLGISVYLYPGARWLPVPETPMRFSFRCLGTVERVGCWRVNLVECSAVRPALNRSELAELASLLREQLQLQLGRHSLTLTGWRNDLIHFNGD